MNRLRIKYLRWYIVVLLCLASELNYMDRATLSVLKKTLMEKLHFDDAGYAIITATFLWVYAFSYLVVGWIVDRIGSRKSLLIFVSGWSIANMLHALATDLFGLAFFRGMLATMEPGSFPAGTKVVSEWFPMRDRALATGIFIAGTSLGTTLAVPIVEVINKTLGWQAAFVLTGSIGLLWVLVWYFCFQLPEDHPNITEEERQLILSERVLETVQPTENVSIFRLIKMRETWGCVSARVCTDPISYFLAFWGPGFIRTKSEYIDQNFAWFGWIPFAAMMIGYIASGAIPRYLIASGWELNTARKTTTLAVSLGLLILCQFVTYFSSPWLALAIFSGVCFGHGAWGNMNFPSEVFPKHVVGTVTGLGGFCGAIVGGIVSLWIGWLAVNVAGKWLLTETQYTTIFGVCSFAYILGLTGVHFFIGKLGVIREIKPLA